MYPGRPQDWSQSLKVLPPQQRAALQKALTIQRRSELVLATGWTFDMLDDQDAAEVGNLTAYINKKSAIEKQRDDMNKPKMTTH